MNKKESFDTKFRKGSIGITNCDVKRINLSRMLQHDQSVIDSDYVSRILEKKSKKTKPKTQVTGHIPLPFSVNNVAENLPFLKELTVKKPRKSIVVDLEPRTVSNTVHQQVLDIGIQNQPLHRHSKSIVQLLDKLQTMHKPSLSLSQLPSRHSIITLEIPRNSATKGGDSSPNVSSTASSSPIPDIAPRVDTVNTFAKVPPIQSFKSIPVKIKELSVSVLPPCKPQVPKFCKKHKFYQQEAKIEQVPQVPFDDNASQKSKLVPNFGKFLLRKVDSTREKLPMRKYKSCPSLFQQNSSTPAIDFKFDNQIVLPTKPNRDKLNSLLDDIIKADICAWPKN